MLTLTSRLLCAVVGFVAIAAAFLYMLAAAHLW